MNFKVRFGFVAFVSECFFLVSQQPLQVYAYPAKRDRSFAYEDASNWQKVKASSSMSTFSYGLAFVGIVLITLAFAKFVYEYVFTDTDADVALKKSQKAMLGKENSVLLNLKELKQVKDTATSFPFSITPTATDSSNFILATSDWTGEDQTTSTTLFNSSCFKTSSNSAQSGDESSENTSELDLLIDSKNTIPKSLGEDDSVIYMSNSNSSVTINKSGVQISSLKKNAMKTKKLGSKVTLPPFDESFLKVYLQELQHQEKGPITKQPQSNGLQFSIQKMLAELYPTVDSQIVIKQDNNLELADEANNLPSSREKPISRIASMFCCDTPKKPASILRSFNSFEIWPNENGSLKDHSPSSSSDAASQEKPASFEKVNFGKRNPLEKNPKSVSFSRSLKVRFFEKH